MIAAVGHSEDLDSRDAIVEALDMCAATLDGKTPQAALLFAGVDHDHQALLTGVEERYPGIPLVGCTTHGELSSTGFTADSVVLMLLHADGVTFRAEVAEDVAGNTEGAAHQVATSALEGISQPARLCIAICEPFGVHTTRLLGKLAEVLGPDVPICGGLAAEQLRLDPTYQFCNGKVYKDSLAILVFAGRLKVSTGVASGWEPVGGDHRVTDADEDGLIINRIDDESTKDVWMRYFGTADMAGYRNLLAAYPDAPDDAPDSNGSDFFISTPFDWGERGSLRVGPPIPEGTRVRFAQVTREQVLEGVEASASQARASFTGNPAAALVFSCASRHGLLGTRVGRELELLRLHVGAATPIIGFYTYGEICPLAGSLAPRAHASTFVSVLIGEHE